MNKLNLNLRPAVAATTTTAPIHFQILAVEVLDAPVPSFMTEDIPMLTQDTFYPPPPVYTEIGEDNCVPFMTKIRYSTEVCVFGTTAEGHSVVVRVNGFMPHLYIELNNDVTEAVVHDCMTEMRNKMRLGTSDIRVETVMKKRVFGWEPVAGNPMDIQQFKFACVYFKNTCLLRTTVKNLESASFMKLQTLRSGARVDVSEYKVAPSEKFLAAHNLKPSGWATLPPQTYHTTTNHFTVSQLEVTCSVGALVPLEKVAIAPLVIAAMDIETQSHDYRSMPDAHNPGDMVTFIGTTFWVYGDTQPRARVMLVLGACDPTPSATATDIQVVSFPTEYELLVGWRDLIAVHSDPDMVVSYNGTGFDYAYLADRLVRLVEYGRATRFNHLGRFMLEQHPLNERELSSAAKGQNQIRWFPMPGRVQMDLYMYVKDSQKLSSYKLDDVCAAFLPDTAGKVVLDHAGWVRSLLPAAESVLMTIVAAENREASAAVAGVLTEAKHACPDTGDYTRCHELVQKAADMVADALQGADDARMEAVRVLMDTSVQPVLDASSDNNYRKLFRLYDTGAAARASIVEYCQVDCDLVVQLLDRLNVVANTMQMSQVCNTQADDVCNRGQQIKTFNLIARECKKLGYVMNQSETGWDVEAEYEGATVLPPIPGYYQTPVATLDFASLYPSLMIAYNLCFSSLVLNPAHTNLEGVEYVRCHIAGKDWVFQQCTTALLPRILTGLLKARRAKKKEMKQYDKSSMEYRLCDGAQLALKVSCNSVYGFCGVVNKGKFPCLPVAVATTFKGREAISRTKAFVEKTYNATVVYGDTDSVMLTFPGITTVEAAFLFAERVAEETSAIFPEAVVLEFEKVFFPYLLLKRKTYSGMKYEDDPSAAPSLDVKGLAVVRRDNCGLVREVMKEVLNLTMRDNNPLAAYEVVKTAVHDLVADRVPLHKLQITNALKKTESYSNTAQPQLVVVQKMIERRAFDVPRPGDRVPYIITTNHANPRVSDRAEHPRYVAEHRDTVKVDTAYYLINQVKRRMEGILGLLPVPDVEQLFYDAMESVKARGIDTSNMSMFVSTNSAPGACPRRRNRLSASETDSAVNTSAMGGGVASKRVTKRQCKMSRKDVDKKVSPLLGFGF